MCLAEQRVCVFPDNIYLILQIKIPQFARPGLNKNFPVTKEINGRLRWRESKAYKN